jgi:hypothetical protein
MANQLDRWKTSLTRLERYTKWLMALARIFHKLARALTCLLINKKDFAQSGV